MFSLIKRQKRPLLFFVLLIVVLVVVSFWRSLDFYFWRDDWDLWSQQYYFWKILQVHNHPGTWVSRALLFHILGWNRLAWQSLGLILRIGVSLSASLLILGITKSKKIGVLAGVFSATTIFGMETVIWASVYIVPIVTILDCLGFYMWILFVEKRSYKYALISILLIILASLGDPGRAIFIVPIIAIWEILNWWISLKRERVFLLILRVGLFIAGSFLFMKFFLSIFYGSRISLWDSLKSIVSDWASFTTFSNSIGNLLIGWLKSPAGGDFHQLVLPVIIILLFIGFYLGFLKKSKIGMTLLLLTLWIPIMYIPDWLANKSVVVTPTDHYLAMSAVGYIGILALLIGSVSIRWLMYLVTISFVFINIKTANEVLISESSFRSYKIVEPYFNQIEKDVAHGEMNSIFIYLGNDNAKYVDLDWSGSLPFGVKRGFTKYEDFPITTSDDKLILKLLCEDNVYRPSMFDWIYQKKRIQLSHLHAWELNGGVLTDVSVQEREKYRQLAKVNNCIVKE